MDITIPNNYSIHARPGNAAAMESQPTIDFHKHCQRTVCSAFGYNGAGATWDEINNLQSSDVPYFPSDWKDYFTRNTQNITQDLAAILKLINKTAAKIGGAATVNFQDNTTSSMTRTFSLTPSQQTNIKMGRTVTL